MAYQNRECNYCGQKYYVCLACQRRGSWKTVCCSRKCWRLLMAQKDTKVEEVVPNVISEGETNVTGKLKNRKKVSIVGYDLQLGRFDCDDGETRVTDDFKEFTLSNEEMHDIIDKLNFLSEA